MKIDIGAVFQQIAFCASCERSHQIGFVGVHAQNDDADLRILLHQLSSRLDTVQCRHRNIHDDDVWDQFLRHSHGFAAFGCLAYNFEIGVLFELKAQALAHDTVIIRDQNADLFHARTPAGSSTRMVVPFLGCERRETFPSSSCTRSCIPSRPRPPGAAAGLNPMPSSCTMTTTPCASARSDTRTCFAFACRAQFVSASWTTR